MATKKELEKFIRTKLDDGAFRPEDENDAKTILGEPFQVCAISLEVSLFDVDVPPGLNIEDISNYKATIEFGGYEYEAHVDNVTGIDE